MNTSEYVTFGINHVSVIVCLLVFLASVIKLKSSKINQLFALLVVLMFVFNVGTLLQTYEKIFFHSESFVLILVTYIGICFFPIIIFLLGLSFKNPHFKMSPVYYSLLVFPVLSLTFICVPYLRANYFFIYYSTYSNEAVYGIFYYIHSAYSYIFILIGIFNILIFSVKNSGFFSKQSISISIGIIVAATVNVLYSFNILHLTFDVTACSFAIAMLCFSISIFRYKFLSVIPIALKKVVDIISDGFIVIDLECRIVDYNNSIIRLFNNQVKINYNEDIKEVLSYYHEYFSIEEFELYFKQIEETGISVNVEKHFVYSEFDKYFYIEFSPVFTDGKLIGMIILFKDITRERKDLEIIRETMTIMLEKERLATLGQMVGGIAHNLKTPILSISGGLEGLNDLIAEYDNSIEDKNVTYEDHHEIAAEMLEWTGKIKTYCSYISDMITTIKGQAVHLNISNTEDREFQLDEFIKRIDMLMKHELKKYHCTLNINLNTHHKILISGEINSLVQIFDNLILNSIYAYNGKDGVIDLNITSSDEYVDFYLIDYGCGIPENVKNKLFKEMITTKGKDGTGLGLYMSYATIKGNFKGKMGVESKPGIGTKFYISIPYKKSEN